MASPFSSNALGNLDHIFTNGICASPTWSQLFERRKTNMHQQMYLHAHYKSKAPLNRLVLQANHTKMGVNWPKLGPRLIGPLPSLQTSAEMLAPSVGTTILLIIITNFVDSIRGRCQLWHEIYLRIENPNFCINQVTPVSSVTNHQWRVLNQFYALIYSHLTS